MKFNQLLYCAGKLVNQNLKWMYVLAQSKCTSVFYFMGKTIKTHLELIKPDLCWDAMCVYKFTLDTGFYYIGGTTNLGERISDHLKFYRSGTQAKAIMKALDEAKVITFDFVRFVNNREDLAKWEQSHLERNVGLPLCLNVHGKIITTYIAKEALHKVARVTNGTIDKIYKSLQEAALDNGISIRTIDNNCKAKYPRGPVLFRRLDTAGNIITPLKPLIDNSAAMKEVRQFDKHMRFIKWYESVSDAARELKVDRKSISKVANGKQKSSYGFIYRYVNSDGTNNIPVYNPKKYIPKQRVVEPSKPVNKLDNNGNVVEMYRSTYMAIKLSKIEKAKFMNLLKNGNPYEGYIFKYA